MMSSIQDLLSSIIDDDTIESINDIKSINIPTVPVVENNIRAPRFDPETNILSSSGRAAYEYEIINIDRDTFTELVHTTTTIEGFIKNVQFHENKLIKMLTVNEKVVNIKCNWDNIKYSEYNTYEHVKHSKRGRKKKVKVSHRRNSNSQNFTNPNVFHSQISFEVLPKWVNVESSSKSVILPSYKFKVFRNGKIQLPGANPNCIDDILFCVDIITNLLNAALYPNGGNSVKIINLNPIMKNYKFSTIIPNNHIIDLCQLKKLVVADKINNIGHSLIQGTEIYQPIIYDIQYSRQDTKLAIVFATPIPGKSDKRTRINIFQSGKINILGGLNTEYTNNICKYIQYVIKTNYDSLVVEEGIIIQKKQIISPPNPKIIKHIVQIHDTKPHLILNIKYAYDDLVNDILTILSD